MSDAITSMLDDLRQARPNEFEAFGLWLEAISQVIAAHPTELRRVACMILVANDICAATGVSLTECVRVVRMAVKWREVER